MTQPREPRSKPLTVAVIGDSRATNYGAPPSVKAFPQVLGEISGGRLEVRNLAKESNRLDRLLRDPAELLDWRPDIVVSAYGGRESMYRMPKYLKRLPCPPDASIRDTGWGKLWPLAWVRRQVWRDLLWLLANHPKVGERVFTLMKANVYRTTAQYRESVSELFQRMSPWRPRVIFLLPLPSGLGQHVFSPRHKAATGVVARDFARQMPERVSVWDPKADVDFTGLFLSDRVHLTAEGHRLMAASLLAQIEKLVPLPSAPQVPGPSTGVAAPRPSEPVEPPRLLA